MILSRFRSTSSTSTSSWSMLDADDAPHSCISMSANRFSNSHCCCDNFELSATFSFSTVCKRSRKRLISSSKASCEPSNGVAPDDSICVSDSHVWAAEIWNEQNNKWSMEQFNRLSNKRTKKLLCFNFIANKCQTKQLRIERKRIERTTNRTKQNSNSNSNQNCEIFLKNCEIFLNLIDLVEIVAETDVMLHGYAVVRQNCAHLDLLSRANQQLCYSAQLNWDRIWLIEDLAHDCKIQINWKELDKRIGSEIVTETESEAMWIDGHGNASIDCHK